MLRWNNDYNMIAHSKVLEALAETKENAYAGYGADECCAKAAEMIRDATKCPEATVYFLPGATQANFIVVNAALRPIESVICADSGHIFCHEAGSIENTSHKMLALPATDGKITAAQIEAEAEHFFGQDCPEYLTKPSMVYISFSSEWGTIYSLAELEAISAVCKKYDMYLFVDGARLAYGLGAATNDVTLPDLARLCDVFYLGGTKCGAMFGEALVITNSRIARGFRTFMKQSGAVMAKSWLMGVQFMALLKDGLYLDLARRADAYAMEIREAFIRKGVRMFADNPTNQQFPILTPAQAEKIGKKHIYEDICRFGDDLCVRFCTSWATKREDVDQLINDICDL